MSLPSLNDQGSGWTLEEDLTENLEFVLCSFGREGLEGRNGVVVTRKVDLRESIFRVWLSGNYNMLVA